MKSPRVVVAEPQAASFAQIAVTLTLIVAVYELLSKLGYLSFATVTQDVVGLSTIFVIGLTASMSSCLAMVGGLLLSVSAKWSESHPSMGHLQKFEPLFHFNAGRIAGFFLFGGLTGLVGKALVLSVKTTGIVKIALAVVMIGLGLSILRIVPKAFCSIPLPKSMMKRIHALTNSNSVFAPFALGAATYFVPCGFTQSMQLLALGSGNFLTGASIMTTFALGTMPALLGISAASAYADGKVGRAFYVFAGTLSIFLGLLSIDSGLALTGTDWRRFVEIGAEANVLTQDPSVSIDRNGQQIISVTVKNSGYDKDAFIISADKPTWIYATAPEGLSGCLSGMAIPAFDISKPISKGENWIGPIKPTKDFAFMCSAGIFRADVHVRS